MKPETRNPEFENKTLNLKPKTLTLKPETYKKNCFGWNTILYDTLQYYLMVCCQLTDMDCLAETTGPPMVASLATDICKWVSCQSEIEIRDFDQGKGSLKN